MWVVFLFLSEMLVLEKTHDVELWFIELQMLLGGDIWREVILVQPPTQNKTIANTSLGQLQLLAFKICQDRLHLSGNISWCPAWTCKANVPGVNLVLSTLLLPSSTFRLCETGPWPPLPIALTSPYQARCFRSLSILEALCWSVSSCATALRLSPNCPQSLLCNGRAGIQSLHSWMNLPHTQVKVFLC